MDFTWAQTEKTKGHYDFSAYDKLLAAMQRYHLRGLWILDYGNPLYQHGQSPSTPAARQAFCRWVAAAMRHFKGHGIMWEMWNEPDGFWTPPPPEPSAYDQLAVAVGRTIWRVAPHELYVGPALLCTDVHDPNLGGLKAYFKGGVLRYFDAVTLHPYRTCVGLVQPETVQADYQRIRRLIAADAPKGKHIPIISSEWGYPTSPGAYGDGGARYAAREFLVDLYEKVPVSIWYDWYDNSPSFRLIDVVSRPGHKPVYKPRPAYRAIKTLATALYHCRLVRRLKVGGAGDYVLLFRSPKGRRIAAWKLGAKPARVTIPLPPGRYRLTNDLGTTTRTLVVPPGHKQLSLTISHNPQYLDQLEN